jgi:hypothetical protein
MPRPRPATVATSNQTRERMTACLHEMITRLTFCLAVERDRELQRAMRSVADCTESTPLYVMPSPSRAWLLLQQDRPVRLVDEVPDGARRLAMHEMQAGHNLWKEIFVASARVRADERAWKLLSPIFSAGASPTANEIARLLKWAPIIEMFAYQCFTTASMLVNGMRGKLLTASMSAADRDGMLVEYWTTLHTMGHLLTIASSPAARPWLADMASSFTWKEWTPSFVLSRERTLWLMAAAAKSALAFGETVLDRYLNKLSRSDHPIKSFDALLGLVAIGLDRPDISRAIVTEIEAVGALSVEDRSQSDFVKLMTNCAIETLLEPQAAEKLFDRWTRDSSKSKLAHPKLLGLDALRLDSSEITPEGQLLGLVALPSIIRSPLGGYYPRHSNPALLISPRDISLILERAWATASSDYGSRILH